MAQSGKTNLTPRTRTAAKPQTDNADNGSTAAASPEFSAEAPKNQATDTPAAKTGDTDTAKDTSVMTALFAAPSIVEDARAASRPKRPKVDVPEHVLDALRVAKENSERRAWPLPPGITEEQYKEMCLVFYSAADTLGGTAGIMLGKQAEDQPNRFERVKELSQATHVRVSIGRRRGATKKNGAKDGANDSDK